MAIFGSYLDKNHTLLGESVNVIILDTFVAVTAGLIIFPACFTFGVEVKRAPVCSLTPWLPCSTTWPAAAFGARCSSCL